MRRDDWLEVSNSQKLIDFSRKLVYYNFDDETALMDDTTFLNKIDNIENDYDPEMDVLLPFEECELIFTSFTFMDNNLLYITDDDYDTFLMQMNRRMISNIVQGLVKKGVLHTAFDNEKNDFIFWVKTEEEMEAEDEDSETN
tara:strand:- start:629 stop:1054 length:426 start_codon:yes stop_codon:yes gene_type:complete